MPSPAEIIRSCLADQNLVIIPDDDGDLPLVQLPEDSTAFCFVSKIPDQPDQMVAIADVTGRIFGRSMKTGKMMQDFGIILTIRSLTFTDGWNLGVAIYDGLGKITQTTTIIAGITHYIANVIRTGTLMYVGEEVGRKRELFTIHARVAFQYQEAGLPE